MAHFQRRPSTLVVFEANQYDGMADCLGVICNPETGKAYVTTIQGQTVEIKKGEWAIQEPDKIHYYPCSDEIFQARYEESEE